jgi:hypothetical protein
LGEHCKEALSLKYNPALSTTDLAKQVIFTSRQHEIALGLFVHLRK